jgi:hypothetical protein
MLPDGTSTSVATTNRANVMALIDGKIRRKAK